MDSSSTATAPRQTVLLVEDDAMVRDTIILMLEDVFETLAAVSVATAMAHLQTANRRRIECILLDCLLPDGNLDVILHEAARAEIPVVFISGDLRQAERLSPVRPFLAKPFTPVRLISTIRSALG